VAFHAIEFLVLFIAAPTLFAFGRHRIPAIPALWVAASYCLYILLHDPGFDRRHLWNASALASNALEILSIFAFAVVIGIVLILRFEPAQFLSLPRKNPKSWVLLLVLYPVVSVYPQGIIYRAFMFERYRDLFGPPWAMVLASAFAFTYMHIVFRNKLALVLTALGGLLFGMRYLETGSLFVSSLEHALYGCAIFTLGIGRCFYSEDVRR
jgi:membrane protease YdiL (CAAX protease family)